VTGAAARAALAVQDRSVCSGVRKKLAVQKKTWSTTERVKGILKSALNLKGKKRPRCQGKRLI